MINDSKSVNNNMSTFLKVLMILGVISIAAFEYAERREIFPAIIMAVLFYIIAALMYESFPMNAAVGTIVIALFFYKFQKPGNFYFDVKLITYFTLVSFNMHSILKDIQSRKFFNYELAKAYSWIHNTATFIIALKMTDLVKDYIGNAHRTIIFLLIAIIYFLFVTKIFRMSNVLQMLLVIASVVLTFRFSDYKFYLMLFCINMISNMIYYKFFYSWFKELDKSRNKGEKEARSSNSGYSYNSGSRTSYGSSSSYSSYNSSSSEYNASHKTSARNDKKGSRSDYKAKDKSDARNYYDSNGCRSGCSWQDESGNRTHYDSNGGRKGHSYTDEYGSTTHYDSDGARKGYSSTDEYGSTTHYDEDGCYKGFSTTDSDGLTTHYDEDGCFKGYSD